MQKTFSNRHLSFINSIGRGAMNAPIPWNLRTGYLNCARWNKDFSALCGYPTAQLIFCPLFQLHSKLAINKQGGHGMLERALTGWVGGLAKLAKISAPITLKKIFRMILISYRSISMESSFKCNIQKSSSIFYIVLILPCLLIHVSSKA